MKSSLLTDYVIVCVALSAIILLGSYIVLSWTTKVIPSEMTTLIGVLATGAFAAAGSRNNLQSDSLIKKSFVNFSLMGFATTKVFLVINYSSLVWAEKVIPKELAPMIGILAGTILTVTTFRKSESSKLNNSSEDVPIK